MTDQKSDQPGGDVALRRLIFKILSEEITQPRPEYLPAHFNDAVSRLLALVHEQSRVAAAPPPARDGAEVGRCGKCGGRDGRHYGDCPTRDGAEGAGRRTFDSRAAGFTLADCGCRENECEGRTDGTCHHPTLEAAPPKPASLRDTNSVADSTGSEPGTHGTSKKAGGHSRGGISPVSALSPAPAAMREAQNIIHGLLRYASGHELQGSALSELNLLGDRANVFLFAPVPPADDPEPECAPMRFENEVDAEGFTVSATLVSVSPADGVRKMHDVSLLNERDNFIVSKGLWSEFTDSLSRQAPPSGSEGK